MANFVQKLYEFDKKKKMMTWTKDWRTAAYIAELEPPPLTVPIWITYKHSSAWLWNSLHCLGILPEILKMLLSQGGEEQVIVG
jgi:hypothetical protein